MTLGVVLWLTDADNEWVIAGIIVIKQHEEVFTGNILGFGVGLGSGSDGFIYGGVGIGFRGLVGCGYKCKILAFFWGKSVWSYFGIFGPGAHTVEEINDVEAQGAQHSGGLATGVAGIAVDDNLFVFG